MDRLPKRIKVGPYRIRICQNGQLKKHGREAEYEPAASEIRYCPDLSTERLRTTIMHELVHAAFDVAELNDEKDVTEEAFIKRLTPILVAMLRDNPDLVKFICAGA